MLKRYGLFAGILLAVHFLFGGAPFMPKFLWPIRHVYFLILAGLAILSTCHQQTRNQIKKVFQDPELALSSKRADQLIIIISTFFLFVFLKVTALNFMTYKVVDVDFSYFDMMIANFMRGKDWFSSACNCNHFGVHSTYIFYLLAPFHRLFNSPWFLVLLHGVTLWSTIIPLKKLMTKANLTPIFQVIICFAFFNFFATSHILKYSFHMEVFFVPFFLWLFYFFEQSKWRSYYLMVFLTLAVKEDAGFYLIGMSAAYFLCQKENRRHTVFTTIISAIITIISLKWVIPHYRGSSDYIIASTALKYGSSMGENLLGMLKNPHLVAKDILTGSWLKFLIPSLFMQILVPFFLIGIAPFVLIHSTAGAPLMHTLMLYYSAPYVPFIFYGLIKFLQGERFLVNEIFVTKTHQLALLIFFTLYGALVGSGFLRYYPITDNWHQINQIKTQIMPQMRLCAQGSIYPHLGYDNPLETLKFCYQKEQDLIIINPTINHYPYTAGQLQDIIIQLRGSSRYEEIKRGHFTLFANKLIADQFKDKDID